MSGHSKWSQIKRQKMAGDQKRGLMFGKLAKAIEVAVNQGGGVTDPDLNVKLRLAIEKAKGMNMPKENIERAILRTKEKGSQLEEWFAEALTFAGEALLIQLLTANKKEALQSIKTILEKQEGKLMQKGAVSYLFSRCGVITIDGKDVDANKLLSLAIDMGAIDFEEEDDSLVYIYTQAEDLHRIKEELEEVAKVQQAEIIYRPKMIIPIDDGNKADKLLRLIESLEELPEVQNVYVNFDIKHKV